LQASPPAAPTSAAVRLEACAGCERIPRVPSRDRCAERLQPVEIGVQALEEESLQELVALRAFGPKGLEVPMAPNDAAREPHRPAGTVELLEDERLGAQAAGLGGSREPCHSGAGDDEIGHGIRA
jgi:hypothetical protein